MKDFDCECRELWRKVYAAEIQRGGTSDLAESKANTAVLLYKDNWSS